MLRKKEKNTFQLVKDGIPLTATFYDKGYATTRVPGEEYGKESDCKGLKKLFSSLDELVHNKNCRHEAVFCHGCWYKVDLYNDNGELHTAAEFEK